MKRSVILVFALSFLAILLLAGCTSQVTRERAFGQGEWPALRRTPISAPASPTLTPSPTSMAAATATATPTPLPTGTATPTPTPSPIPTFAPSPAAATAEAESPAQPLQGKLAFQEASGGNIYLINADGTGLRLLTQGMDPALSPDGKFLAFARWDKDKGLYLMGLESGEARLIWGADCPKSPVWSPDGSKLAYTSRYIGELSPKGPQGPPPMRGGRLPKGMGEALEQERWALHILNLWDGSAFDPRCDWFSFSPSWGPDGKTLVYDGTEGLRLVTGDQEPWFLLYEHYDPSSPPPEVLDQSPAWSPDGQFIAYMHLQHDHWEIYTVRPDGSDKRRLTKEPLFVDDAPNNVAPAWSPDGRHIAFLSDRSGRWELWVMDADGSNQRKLFDSRLAGVNLRYDFASERVVSWSW